MNGNGTKTIWQITGTVIAAIILASLAFVYNGITELRSIVDVHQVRINHIERDLDEHSQSEAHDQAIRRLESLDFRMNVVQQELNKK